MSNCEYCSTYGDFVCKKCSINYSLKHDNNIACVETTSLEGNNNYYTNDSKINYYNCRLFNEVENCGECSNKETCDKCQTGFNKYNENKLCVRQSDIDNNIFIWTNDNILTPCSNLIENCRRCNNSTSCYSCQEEAALIDNDTCIPKALIEENENYFRDATTQKYISCSVISNCVTCDSSTVCTSCLEGFILNNNNKCDKIDNTNNNNDSDDDSSRLSTGAIIGIVFGCLGFLLIVAGVAYFLINNVFKKKKDDINVDDNNIDINKKVEIVGEKNLTIPQNEEKGSQNENQNQPIVHSTKRSIHNDK